MTKTMKTQPHKTERIHSLDSLRAIMMLLGLVIHSALTYGAYEYGDSWSIKDLNATHWSNDYIVSFIHAFRMQLFFLVAGFFGSMLFYERQPKRMVQNRLKRILFPFIVFVILLWPTILFSFGYSTELLRGNANALSETLSKLTLLNIMTPNGTFHLWFLYYLVQITFVSVLLGLLFKKLPVFTGFISNAFRWTIQKPLVRVLIFAAISAAIYFLMGTWSVSTSNSWVPDTNTFIYYLTFYMIGWVLFKSKSLLDLFMKNDWANTVLAIALFSAYYFGYDQFSYEGKIVIKSFIVWLFIFGLTGLFIRFGSNHSARMRYVSDSSYWVYLVHLSLTAWIPSLIIDWPLPATLKFIFVLSSTAVICFVSYHYLVRGTFIGKFLNGRKYTGRLADIRKNEESVSLKPAQDKPNTVFSS